MSVSKQRKWVREIIDNDLKHAMDYGIMIAFEDWDRHRAFIENPVVKQRMEKQVRLLRINLMSVLGRWGFLNSEGKKERRTRP